MNTAILILGVIGVILLLLTIYSYFTAGRYFKIFAYGFLATAVTAFVLIVIKNLKEQFGAEKNHKEESK